MLKIIRMKLINQYFNDFLASYFDIDKIKEFVNSKYN